MSTAPKSVVSQGRPANTFEGRIVSLSLVAALVAWCGQPPALAVPPAAEDHSAGIEVLARGPVHEAFAGTVTYDPEPGIVVPGRPPDPIEELPPEQRPAGDNVEWIPGYWAWDDEGEDFLWVSGLWRNLPPGRQWVSGYWAASRQGAQWISGYWADAQLTEAEYLPEPPESVETGPNVAAPSADHLWLPGGWVWQNNRYGWRPGFWSPVQPNWVWIPAHYLWAPRGYVYVDGYWDYALDHRGILFAPVSFSERVYAQRGFSYTPATVIDLGVFVNHLFLRPNYGHYYYGDYYGANYASVGFYPSYSFHSGRLGYDPIYARQRWNHRQDDDWERRVQADYQHRRDHEDARPPRTFAAQRELARKGLAEQDQGRVFARPLEQFTKARDNPIQFQPLDDEDRQRFGRVGRDVRTHREERQKLEAQPVDPAAERPAREIKPARVRLPRSPFVAKPAEQLGREQALPPRHQAPEVDPRVQPKPRQPRGGPLARGNPTATTPQASPQARPGAQARPTPQAQPQAQPRGRSGAQPRGAAAGQPRGAAQPQAEPPQAEQAKPRGKPPAASSEKSPAAAPAKSPGRSQDKPRPKPDKE
ncbi:MAG TPA: hypothetical protein VML55_21440 [Planctomycetaceae bacterium]|nr:hypothetical protein [Planctomycetaceae bacterium]